MKIGLARGGTAGVDAARVDSTGTRGERRDDPIHRRDIVAHIVAQVLTALGGPQPQLLERVRVVAEVLVLFRQRVPYLHFAAPIGETLGGEGLKFGDVIAMRGLGPQIRAIHVGLEIAGAQRDDPIVVGLRLAEAAEKAAHRCPIENVMRVVGREGHGSLEGCERVLLIAEEAEQAAEAVEQRRVRRARECGERSRAGIATAPQRQQALRLAEQPLRRVGFRPQRLVPLLQGVGPVLGAHQPYRFAGRVDHGLEPRRPRRAVAVGAMPGT